jgi:hypothetical protein
LLIAVAYRSWTRPVATEELGAGGDHCSSKHLAAVWSDGFVASSDTAAHGARSDR